MSEQLPIHNSKNTPNEVNKASISRREFLKASLLGLGGIAVGDYGINEAFGLQEDEEKVKVKTKVLFPKKIDNIFPREWSQTPIIATFLPLDKSEEKRSRGIIELALKKYDPKVLNDNLTSVYLVSAMSFYENNSFGGTYSSDAVYIRNEGHASGYTDQYIEETFHKEFSSILLRNNTHFFDRESWNNINPNNFSYQDPSNGVDNAGNGIKDDIVQNSLLEDGFLTEYQRSSLEQDFNKISGMLFSGEEEFWEIVDTYPRVKKKVQLAIKFYNNRTYANTKLGFLSSDVR